nr:MAG TPA: hypothetical protein [Caudoviricetes sp.]
MSVTESVLSCVRFAYSGRNADVIMAMLFRQEALYG